MQLNDEQLKAAGIKLLSEQCGAYRDLVQYVVDNLSAVNLLIEARIKNNLYAPKFQPGELLRIQRVNQSVMERIRG